MKVTITYDRLVQSGEALVALSKVPGLKPGEKMLIAKTRRMIAGDLTDIEEQRVELAKKYSKIGHTRMVDEVKARAAAMDEGPDKEKTLEAADAIAEPQGVLPQENQAFQVEYTKLLEQTAEITIPNTRIKASVPAKDNSFLPEHLFALDWLLEDDISPPDEDDKTGPTPAAPAPAAQAPAVAAVPEPERAPAPKGLEDSEAA